MTFQEKTGEWLLACIGIDDAMNKTERNHRFLEEALELVQSAGCTKEEAHQLVNYVFNRPVGETRQEVGGVMITLASLCNAHGLDMDDAGASELKRVWTKIEQIRVKHFAKPRGSALPGVSPEEASMTFKKEK